MTEDIEKTRIQAKGLHEKEKKIDKSVRRLSRRRV